MMMNDDSWWWIYWNEPLVIKTRLWILRTKWRFVAGKIIEQNGGFSSKMFDYQGVETTSKLGAGGSCSLSLCCKEKMLWLGSNLLCANLCLKLWFPPVEKSTCVCTVVFQRTFRWKYWKFPKFHKQFSLNLSNCQMNIEQLGIRTCLLNLYHLQTNNTFADCRHAIACMF
jgi:hypothetical protein